MAGNTPRQTPDAQPRPTPLSIDIGGPGAGLPVPTSVPPDVTPVVTSTSPGLEPLALNPGGPLSGQPLERTVEQLIGDFPVGTESAPLPVTVVSKLRLDATITRVEVGPGFTVAADRCTGVLLTGGASCQLDVVFRPTKPGRATTVIQLAMTHLCADEQGICKPEGEIATNHDYVQVETPAGLEIRWSTALDNGKGRVKLVGSGV